MRILVGSDLTPASDEAVRQGLALVREGQNELGLCHVLPEAQLRTLFPQEHELDLEALLVLQPRVAEFLHLQVERLSPGESLPFSVFVEQGSDYAELIARAEQWNAGLIVIGHHGRAGLLSRSFMQSVAEHVVRDAPCAVLVARKRGDGVVLVATDLSDPALLAIEAGAKEAARRKCRLVVMHATEALSRRAEPAMALFGAIPVVDTPEISKQRADLVRQIIAGALTRFGAEGETRVIDGDPSTEILRLVETLPAELLVVSTRGRSNLSRLMLGSVAAHMVRSAPCSVLAVRQEVSVRP